MDKLTTLGVYATPLRRGEDRGGALSRLYAHYRSVLLPRDAAYMRALFAQHFPAGRFIDTGSEPDWRDAVQDAGAVVLLYPDPIGFGFAPIEREVRARMSPIGSLRALTGRRRLFLLSPSARLHLALRRFLTRFLVVETVLGTALLVATPVLAAADLLRGRR